MRNSCGQTPLDLAREAGHGALADELDRIDTIRQRARELDRSERVFARPGTKYRSVAARGGVGGGGGRGSGKVGRSLALDQRSYA